MTGDFDVGHVAASAAVLPRTLNVDAELVTLLLLGMLKHLLSIEDQVCTARLDIRASEVLEREDQSGCSELAQRSLSVDLMQGFDVSARSSTLEYVCAVCR